MNEPTKEEIAWAAGLFEGEGHFKFQAGVNTVGMGLNMSDEDAVRDFHRIVGVGAVRFRTFANHYQTQWVWQTADRDDVRSVIEKFLPWLKTRRRAAAHKALGILECNVGDRGKRTHCIRGHALSGDNLYINPGSGNRHCRTCHRDRERKRYQERVRST